MRREQEYNMELTDRYAKILTKLRTGSYIKMLFKERDRLLSAGYIVDTGKQLAGLVVTDEGSAALDEYLQERRKEEM